MIEVYLLCDICNDPIPKEVKTDIFGIEKERCRLGEVDADGFVVDFQKLGMHVCERCSDKISILMMKEKQRMLSAVR